MWKAIMRHSLGGCSYSCITKLKSINIDCVWEVKETEGGKKELKKINRYGVCTFFYLYFLVVLFRFCIVFP